MSRTIYRATPVNGYDISALEDWLEQQAANGLRFSLTLGPLTLFERTDAGPVRIHLEPIQGKSGEDPELTALYEDAGWTYLGMFRSSYFVFSTSDPQATAHTDPQVLDYALKRFFKQKLVSGGLLLILNALVLALYHVDLVWDRLWYFPVTALFNLDWLPYLLSLLGFGLVDLSYLLGLWSLFRLRRHRKTHHRSRSGWLLVAGVAVLIPVIINTAYLYLGLSYRPYDLKGSDFVTLTEIEGDDFRLSGDRFYSMDFISRGSSPLSCENWFFQQCGAFSHYDGGIDREDVPSLELYISRYPFVFLAERRTEEWARAFHTLADMYSYYPGYSDGFETLPAGHGLDQISVRPDEEKPGMSLLLRRGRTVLRAEYRGDKDLTDYLDRFSEMMEGL